MGKGLGGIMRLDHSATGTTTGGRSLPVEIRRCASAALQFIPKHSFKNHTESKGIDRPGLKILSAEVEKLIDGTGNG